MTDQALLAARSVFLRAAFFAVMLAPFAALLHPRDHADLLAISLIATGMVSVSLWWWCDHLLDMRRVVRSLAASLGTSVRRDGAIARPPANLEGN
ncbi:MAG: hypothetical protein H6835_08895 [Planctomycetes bacterium]|nr:hypothetical protein [Planctomycetota bacterium]